MTWEIITRAGRQLRTDQGHVFAVDLTAVLLLAQAMGADPMLLVEVLPSIEPIIVRSHQTDGG